MRGHRKNLADSYDTTRDEHERQGEAAFIESMKRAPVRVGVVAAFQPEMDALAFAVPRSALAAWRVCGVGKVNAARATTELILQHDIDVLLMVGACAAGHGLEPTSPAQRPHTIASDECVQYSFSFGTDSGGEGVHRGAFGSGDRFVTGDTHPFKGRALDRESGAFAQVCEHYKKSWLVIKPVTDYAEVAKTFLDSLTGKSRYDFAPRS